MLDIERDQRIFVTYKVTLYIHYCALMLPGITWMYWYVFFIVPGS